MARHRSFVRVLMQVQRQTQRELARKRVGLLRGQARIQTQAARAAEQTRKNHERALVSERREQARLYTESRQAQVTLQNEQLERQIESLEHLLLASLAIDPFIDIRSLKQPLILSVFNPGPLGIPEPSPQWLMYMPPMPTGIQKLLPGAKARHAQAVMKAQETYQAHIGAHTTRETGRQQALAQMKANYDRQVIAKQRRIAAQHAEVDAFQRDLQAGLPQAIVKYFTMILTSSVYPDKFSKKVNLTYIPESKQLVVGYSFPTFDVVPKINSYKYINANDSIKEMARPQAQRKSLYMSIIAQVTLRTLSELFRADRMKCLDTIVFSGFVDGTDESSGQSIHTCLVVIHASRDVFTRLDLNQVAPQACLALLNASVSRNPSELVPVRPPLESGLRGSHFQERSIVKNKAVQAETHLSPHAVSDNTKLEPIVPPIRRTIELNQKRIGRLHEESEQLQDRLTIEDEEQQQQLTIESVLAPAGSIVVTGQQSPQTFTQVSEEHLVTEVAVQKNEKDRAEKTTAPVELSMARTEHKERPSNRASFIEQRVAVMRRYWHHFDEIHARQQPGMKPLWGLVEDSRAFDFEHRFRSNNPYEFQLYRQLLPSAILAEIEQLWGTTMLPRWPERIISEPFPHILFAEAFGLALKFWHGCALTAWFICEGPSSRTDLAGLAEYYHKDVQALKEIGTPINEQLFGELARAETQLGQPQPFTRQIATSQENFGITITATTSYGTRRKGFEKLRDIITFHRRQWAKRYLDLYLQRRWETEIHENAHSHKLYIDEKGIPPTAKQFAKDAKAATNHWFSGNISELYRTIQEQSPLQPQHVTILPADRTAFAFAVFKKLSAPENHSPEQKSPQIEKLTNSQYYQLNRLAVFSFWYVQLEEALGYTPTLSNFGSSKFGPYSKALNINTNKAWDIFASAIEEAKQAFPAPKVAQTIRLAAQANLEAVSQLQKEAERLRVHPTPEPAIRPAVPLNQEAISKLREESAHLQERLAFEREEEQNDPMPEPEVAPTVPMVKETTGSVPEVDEDWQSICQQWQSEHWEIIAALYQEQPAQVAMVGRKVQRPISRLIDEINSPVEEQLSDLLIDPETQTLASHFHEQTGRLIHWYFSDR